jgi:hypothetical protein
LYAAHQREQETSAELHHPGTPLSIDTCQHHVETLREEREICLKAERFLREASRDGLSYSRLGPCRRTLCREEYFLWQDRDQSSLALRLAFALATLPQESGSAPGFIFLDELLSAFDAQQAQALVSLLTTGTIARQLHQVVLISHQHAFDREAFRYHIRMEAGQIVESNLSHAQDQERRVQTTSGKKGSK